MVVKEDAPTLVVDGDNLLHRGYWISKDKFINSKGINTGVTYSGIRMLKGYIDQFGSKNIYFAWDKRLVSDVPLTNYRKRILEGTYKQTPTRNVDQTKVHEQEDQFRDVLSSLGVRHMHPRNLEADDVIAWLSRRISGKVVIVSNDGDLLQLINDRVAVYNPIKKITIDHLNFEPVVGVKQKDYLSYRAAVGDTSDNIKGVRGYGKKKGLVLASNLEEEIKKLTDEQLSIFKRNIKLMSLDEGFKEHTDEAPAYEDQFNRIQNVQSDMQRFYQQCQKLEFPSILNHFNEWLMRFEAQGR